MKMFNGSSYAECIKNCLSYNQRITAERKHRLPFLDAQTGIAQSPSHLWRNKNDRHIGDVPTIAFVYPAPQRWRRRRSNFNIYTSDVRWASKPEALDSSELVGGSENDGSNMGASAGGAGNLIKQGTVSGSSGDQQLGAPYTRSTDASGASDTKASQDQSWYDDSDHQMDDYDDPSDGTDYEEPYTKRKSKKKKVGEKKSRPRPQDIPDSEKPYSCKHCGAKYKTKPGLHYHLTHAHVNETNVEKEREKAEAAAAAVAAANAAPIPMHHSPRSVSFVHQSGLATAYGRPEPIPHGSVQLEAAPTRALGKFKGEPNRYCDFCLGDASDNKKTNQPEELINCSDCGRAGHPSCLNFTTNMVISTKKYGWQCIECKSCAMCGTSENDDQLLFCDDCDRGFHMYCLRPPLAAPPEGNWSCHLCVVEFGPNASRPAESARGGEN